jgi:hypothetical protein
VPDSVTDLSLDFDRADAFFGGLGIFGAAGFRAVRGREFDFLDDFDTASDSSASEILISGYFCSSTIVDWAGDGDLVRLITEEVADSSIFLYNC